MLEKFVGDIFVGGVVVGQLQSDRKQVGAIKCHPGGAVGLLELAAGGQRLGAIKRADIVQTQEAAGEDVLAFGVFAVHPPGESEQQLLKNPRQEQMVLVSPYSNMVL